MKDFINRPGNLARIEFWAATTIYVFVVFSLLASAVSNEGQDIWTPNRQQIQDAHLTFNYFQHYFFPQLIRCTTLYLAFLLLNFSIVPSMIRKQGIIQNIFLIILIYLSLGLAVGITDTWIKNHLLVQYESLQLAYNYIFQNAFIYSAWLILMYGFYAVIRYAGEFLLVNSETIQSKYKMITRDGLTAVVLWMISVFVLLITGADRTVIAIWGIIIPFGIGLYMYSFFELIPRSLGKKKPFLSYLLGMLPILLIAVLPVSLILYLFLFKDGITAAINMFNIAFQLLITAPISWLLYKQQLKGKDEITVLRTALGRSNADLDFLRSQINPHFLFNALNTIYGTALQEKADRTSEGIEKLGDMMRFMLQENMQDKISLTREIDYLNNYISLQQLRTVTSPEVVIQAVIDEQLNPLKISPMLLIPFVENAFKHGISLREPSHIKITLQTVGNKLDFDVHNSIHLKPDSDPEKNKSGIGLANVRQRLRLLYPGKHELIIRETGKEFFVHLTIELE
ncbi:sensor histidine kinase [Flavihumibacter sp. R14]|nr:sensor histidine kinase [Flavihumibacter soli]